MALRREYRSYFVKYFIIFFFVSNLIKKLVFLEVLESKAFVSMSGAEIWGFLVDFLTICGI